MTKTITTHYINILLIFSFGVTACSGITSKTINDGNGSSETSQTTTKDEESGAISRPEGWSEETHSNDVEPNYNIVFPENKVNQITINIEPENWETMQANMVALFGEQGTDNQRAGGFPGSGDQPPMGDRPQPGEGAPDGEPPDGFTPPTNGERPQGPGGAPDGGRLGAGDMTPENPMWVEATIEFDGNVWTNVGVRYKGNSSLTSGWRSGTQKLPLKLDFDEFEDEHPEIDNQRFYGFKQLSLANGFSDSSFLRDAATSQILEEAGLPVAKTAFYEVTIDYGEGPVTLGLYTMIEVVDDTVVERYFGNDNGNIYEAEGSAASFATSTYNQIEDSLQKENNDGSDWSDIEALFDVLHSDLRTSDPAAWRAELESVFDVDGFLDWLAIAAVIQHWDAYGNMSHNYYLYNDPDTGQLTWISWDHNMAMSAGMGGGGNRGGGNVSLDKADINDNWPLIRYLLDDPAYYKLYVNYLAETVEGPFNPDHMAETYQNLADLIAPYAAADVGEEAFNNAVQQLIDHAYQRAKAVDEFLSSAEN